jgi:hypothetical protein
MKTLALSFILNMHLQFVMLVIVCIHGHGSIFYVC